ncbi:MAG: pilB1 [Candidatus Magasanikbacteria bacterium]|nr:pilB1 [Candidatus Magasanikbacteria bacterium]
MDGASKITLASGAAEEKLAEKLGALGKAGAEQATMNKALALGVPYIDLRKFPIVPESLALIPEEQAAAVQVICFYSTPEELRLAAPDPQNEKVQDLAYQLGERHKAKSIVYLISAESFEKAMKLYAALPKTLELPKGVELTEEDLKRYEGVIADIPTLQKTVQEVSTTEFFAMIVAAALKLRASDIHIEAEEKDIIVRFRLDGILNEISRLPHERWKQIISRLKLISGLKINVTDRPQDGRFGITQKGVTIDVRVSTLPTVYGESVVMRILKPPAENVTFDDLGIRGKAYQELLAQTQKANGMIITTGPTGSGKTTTLYTILKMLNKPGVKIITIEDPVEYKLAGVNQSQIDHTKDFTFAAALRSILRQDPNVVMVGEIRDLETAETAIQASLTGHLMLSTIHTNSAAGAIPRFMSMGVKPFLLAPALNAIVGQRLVRKLCEVCKKPTELDADKLDRVKKELSALTPESGYTVDLNALNFFGPVGCNECNGLGYRGRVGIYEIFTMSPEIEKMILGGGISEYDIQAQAMKQGMITMAQDGLLKALDGVTSVDEVFRVAD